MKPIFMLAALMVILGAMGCSAQKSSVKRKVEMLMRSPELNYCHGADGISMVQVNNEQAAAYVAVKGHFPNCSEYLKWAEAQPEPVASEPSS